MVVDFTQENIADAVHVRLATWLYLWTAPAHGAEVAQFLTVVTNPINGLSRRANFPVMLLLTAPLALAGVMLGRRCAMLPRRSLAPLDHLDGRRIEFRVPAAYNVPLQLPRLGLPTQLH